MQRRSYLRAGAVGGLAVLGGLAGCFERAGLVRDRRTVSEGRRIEGTDDAMDRERFATVAADVVEAYGDSGIWGVERSEPDHALEFVGAWHHEPEPELPVETGHALACYLVPDVLEDDADLYHFWLWSAARTTDGEESVRSIHTGVELTSDEAGMRGYVPVGDSAEEREGDDEVDHFVVTELFDLGATPPSARWPVYGGEIDVRDGTGVGASGAYLPEWSGRGERLQSLVATCEVVVGRGIFPTVDWTTAVEVRV